MWRVGGENKRSRGTSGEYGECPADGKDGEGSGRGVGKRPLDKGEKGEGTGGFGRGSEGEGYHGKELDASRRREFAVERLLGEGAGERVLPALQGGVVLRWGYGC